MGNSQAVSKLLKMVRPLVINTATAPYINKSLRQDMAQEGYLIVLESIKKYDLTKNVPYLGYLKRALYYGIYRKINEGSMYSLNEEVFDDVEAMEFVQDTSPQALDIITKNEEYAELYRGMASLTEKERCVIIELYFNKKHIAQIALNQGKKYIAVAKTRGRAIKKLREAMLKKNIL